MRNKETRPPQNSPLRCQDAPPPALCPGQPSKCHQPLRPAASSNPLPRSDLAFPSPQGGQGPGRTDKGPPRPSHRPSPNLGTPGTLPAGWGREGEKPLHSQGTEGPLLSTSDLRGPAGSGGSSPPWSSYELGGAASGWVCTAPCSHRRLCRWGRGVGRVPCSPGTGRKAAREAQEVLADVLASRSPTPSSRVPVTGTRAWR